MVRPLPAASQAATRRRRSEKYPGTETIAAAYAQHNMKRLMFQRRRSELSVRASPPRGASRRKSTVSHTAAAGRSGLFALPTGSVAGIVGAACAEALAADGLNVEVWDAAFPGGGVTAQVASSMGKSQPLPVAFQ